MPIDNTALEKIGLFISARELPNLQTFSVTDAFAVIFIKDPRTGAFSRVGETDVVKNTLDPNWVNMITMEYIFEAVQEVKIQIYHYHEGKPLDNLAKHTFIGEAKFTLSSLMRSTNQTSTHLLCEADQDKFARGKLVVRGEAQANTRDEFVVTFACEKLCNKEGWGFFVSSDPFLVISRINEDGTWTEVWKSKVIDSNLSPKWTQTKILMSKLCNGDIERPLKITIYDHESSGKHAFMGEVSTSVRELLASNGSAINVIEPEKQQKLKSKYRNSGTLFARNCSIERHPSFTDFIAGGCELSLVVGIDFTGSNGDPSDPSSLHYLYPPPTLNEYQHAIATVGSILEVSKRALYNHNIANIQ